MYVFSTHAFSNKRVSYNYWVHCRRRANCLQVAPQLSNCPLTTAQTRWHGNILHLNVSLVKHIKFLYILCIYKLTFCWFICVYLC